MRITQTMLVRNTLLRVNQNKTSLHELNSALSTGKRVIDSSDDPVSFSKVTRFKTTIKQSEQFLRNINDANGWVDVTASALDQIVGLIKKRTNETSMKIISISFTNKNDNNFHCELHVTI